MSTECFLCNPVTDSAAYTNDLISIVSTIDHHSVDFRKMFYDSDFMTTQNQGNLRNTFSHMNTGRLHIHEGQPRKRD